MEQKPKRPRVGGMDGFIVPAIKDADHKKIKDLSLTPKSIPVRAPQLRPTQNIEQTSSAKPYEPLDLSLSDQKRRTKSKWTRKRKILTSFLVAFLIFGGFGAWYGSKLVGNLDKVFHGNVFSDANALFVSTKLKGESQGRVNILLAGDSADDPGHAGSDLTDSIMVVSIDTQNHTGFMLSVPRDLWVDIPGWSHQKINAANDIANFSQSGYPKGGMGQLEEIVQTDLGIPIDYYGLIDYSAFKDSVNAVGGITIDIQSSDPRGLFDAYTNLKLPNGEDALNGQQALDLARARGDNGAGDTSYGFPDSDFDRTQHQRQMLVALAQKAKTVGVIANPIRVSQLFNAFGNNIHTDLNLGDVLRLGQITKGMNVSNLQSLTYSDSGQNALLTNYVDPSSGQDALIPSAGVDDFSQIQQYYKQLTSTNPVVREGPTVAVLNGSNTDGLARQEATILTADGFNVVATTDANNEYNSSMIVDLSNGTKPNSKKLLQTLLPKDTTITSSTSTSAEAKEAQNYNANFAIILGDDSSNLQQP
jgi:LCP family protein required for cell wall assembly